MGAKNTNKPSSVSRFVIGMATIYLAPMLPLASCGQPGDIGRAPFHPPIWPCSGWGLHGRPVTRPPVSSYLAISPLPPYAKSFGGRYVSVALSVGSPLLGVTQHPARWSSDFPPRFVDAHRGGHPVYLAPCTSIIQRPVIITMLIYTRL